MVNKTSLFALSPLDGRYLPQVECLKDYFSEAALIKYRLEIESVYLIKLVGFLKVAKLKQSQKNRLLRWVKNISHKDILRVKKIEEETNHDVKAIEYFIKENLEKLDLKTLKPWVHWGLTSEDVNNLAYGLMVEKAKNEVLLPQQIQLVKLVLELAQKYKKQIMPARTHGQIAVPTTLGKELIVFVCRAVFFLQKMISFKMGGKLNGAVGNFNSQAQLYPQKNWLNFSQEFIQDLGLEPTLVTTQIEPAYRLVYFLDLWRQLNNVWLNLCQDCWLYISFNYFCQKIEKKEVGSSTMPHKVNPIDFENAEGNFQLANNLLIFLANKLATSRLQRDLSDSTVKRNLGLVFGYSLLALKSLMRGLEKIEVNKKEVLKEVEEHPEMLSEALQLFLKTKGKEGAYEMVKEKTRGKKVFWGQLVNDLKKVLTKKERKRLLKWEPKNFIGLSELLVEKETQKIKKILKEVL